MDLGKNAINGVGALVVGAIIVGGGLLVAKPQYSSASEYRNELSQVKADRAVKEAKLSSLQSQESDLPALKEKLAALEAQIPGIDDPGGAADVVVRKLPSDMRLESFVYQPLLPLAAPALPVVSLETPASPFDAAPGVLPPTESQGSTEEEPPAGPAGTLQQLPIIITVTSSSYDSLTRYLDALAEGPRLILINSVQADDANATDTNEPTITAVIYGYAFTNAEVAVAPAPVTPEAEAPPAS